MAEPIRKKLVYVAISRVSALTDNNNNRTEQHEFKKQIILNDKSLTVVEKSYAIRVLTFDNDRYNIRNNEGTKRLCESCLLECLATSYCEHFIRTYLKNNFSNWSSGNNDIDSLIRKCQMESLHPELIIEWIPYNNLQNIKYITKGGCSEIYSAKWIGGGYYGWDSEEKQLKRFGSHKVILKNLENVESASNRSWFDEAKSHLTISNKSEGIVKCYGLTQDPTNGNYMLVMRLMDINLRNYLHHHHHLTWKEKVNIAYRISSALYFIHEENAIHRDLHSGNILSRTNWRISDLGFCGPADKPLKNIYGNLPYVAPEVIVGKEYTFASDIYSVGILMWEILSGQPPFNNYEHNYDLAMKIVNGMRPKISGTPSEYKELMKQCWDADPSNRPNIITLRRKLEKMWKDSYSNDNDTNEFNILNHDNSSQQNSSSKLYSLSTSKIYQFENLPEPRNATEEEQEAFHSNPYNFNIPDDIEDFCSKSQDKLETSEGIVEKLRGLNLKDGKFFCKTNLN